MTGVIASIPKFQFSGATGVPLASGTLETYIATTTTLTKTWQDQALSIENTNPIVLDASGSCVLWLSSAVTYKFILKDSLGVIQWTQDNITTSAAIANTLEAALAASGGSAKIGFLQAGTNAVSRTSQDKMREFLSVKDFGAKGDGTTDDTASIQAAFTAAGVTPSTLHFPAGSYKITSAVTLDLNVSGSPTLRRYVNLSGDGPDQSIILCSGASATFVNVIGAFNPGTNNGEHKFMMEGISLQRPTTDLIGTGLAVSLMTSAEFNNVYVKGFLTGATFTDLVGTTFNKCTFSYNITGAVLNKNLYSRANLSSFRDCIVSANRDMGIQIYGCNVLFESCGFESNGRTEAAYNAGYTAYSLWFQGSPDGFAALNMQNCYFEATKGIADVFIAALWTSSYSFEDCSFNRVDVSAYTTNSIAFDDALLSGSSAEHHISLRNTGFLSAGTYVANAARKKVVVNSATGYNKWRFNDLGGNISLYFDVDAYVPDYAGIYSYNQLTQTQTGTYTPVVEGDPGTVGVGTYSVQTGRYSRQGNVVFFSAAVAFSAHTGAGTFKVSLPPIAPSTSTTRFTPINLVWDSPVYTTGYLPISMVDDSIATTVGAGCIRFYLQRFDAGIAGMSIVNTSTSIYLSGSYYC